MRISPLTAGRIWTALLLALLAIAPLAAADNAVVAAAGKSLVDMDSVVAAECDGLAPECRPLPARCEHVSRCAVVAPTAKRLAPPPVAAVAVNLSIHSFVTPHPWVEDPRATRGHRYLLTLRLRI